MIDPGTYKFKIIEANIKVNKQDKRYLQLKLEIQEGKWEGRVLIHHFIPWNTFNWMHNIKSIFTPEDIEIFMLEYYDENTMWVVCQLAVGELVTGKVKQEVAGLYTTSSMPPHRYNSVYLTSKVSACQSLSKS